MADNPNEAVVSDAQVNDDNSTTLPNPMIAKLLTGRIVKFLTGSPPTEFSVHEKVLETTDSGFFQVAFSNGFQEEKTGVLEMPEDDPESFQLLLHWFYGNATGFSNCENSFFEGVSSSVLLKLYALASKYMLKTTHDAIISCMCTRAETTSWLEAGFEEKEVWNYYEINTMEQCQMDKLLLDWVVDGTIGARQPPVDQHHDIFDLLPERIVRAAFKTINQISRGYFNPGCKGRGSAASYFWENEEAAQGGKSAHANPRRGVALINAPNTSPPICSPATSMHTVEGSAQKPPLSLRGRRRPANTDWDF